MKILVDADACPVKDIIVEVAKKFNIKVIFIVNYNHTIRSSGNSEVIVVDNISQSVDIALINKAEYRDIIVTDDYGLASLGLAKKCFCISNSGYIYTEDNIDNLLFRRHMTMKLKNRKRFKMKGNKKRTTTDDNKFRYNLEKLLNDNFYDLL